jgi:Zn ribbon nucleic-acid-binding protein
MSTLKLIAVASKALPHARIGRRWRVTSTGYAYTLGGAIRHEYWLQAEDDDQARVWARGESLEKTGVYQLVNAGKEAGLLAMTFEPVSELYLRECVSCGCSWQSKEPEASDMVRGWIAEALASGDQETMAGVAEFVSDYSCPACATEMVEAQ